MIAIVWTGEKKKRNFAEKEEENLDEFDFYYKDWWKETVWYNAG